MKFERRTKPLRPYQEELKTSLMNSQVNTILQAPTGSGKGNIIVEQTLDYLDQGLPVLIVVPSIDLLDNLEQRFKEFAPKHYRVYFAGLATGREKIYTRKLTIGIYKSVANCLNRLPKFAKVIHEECHHSKAKSWESIIKHYNKAQHYGYTATPQRLDGKPLGDNFKTIVKSPPVSWFIDNGYLSDFKLWSASDIKLDSRTFNDNLELQQKLFNNEAQIGRLADQWERYAFGTKTAVFATGIDHCYRIAHEFNTRYEGQYNDRGIPLRFAVLESNLSADERTRIKCDFINNKYIGIINVAILTEGVDIPDIETVLFARFTWSLSLYLQMAGRALRYVPGKIAKFVDPVGNALEHGSPDMDHDYDLNSVPIVSQDYMCHCSMCDIPMISKSKVAKIGKGGITLVCRNCSTENFFEIIPQARVRRPKAIEIIESDLVEFTANGATMKLYKILKTKLKVQDKVDRIIDLEGVPIDLKIKAIETLGIGKRTAMIYLGID